MSLALRSPEKSTTLLLPAVTNLIVGYPRAWSSGWGESLAVASILARTMLPYFSGLLAASLRSFLAAFLYSGSSVLQCPHHGAYISSSTFLLLSSTTSLKFLPTTTWTGSSSVGSAGRASDLRYLSTLPPRKSSAKAVMVAALNLRASSSVFSKRCLPASVPLTMSVGSLAADRPYSSTRLRPSLSASATANASRPAYLAATLVMRLRYMLRRLASLPGTTMYSVGRVDLERSLASAPSAGTATSGLPKLYRKSRILASSVRPSLRCSTRSPFSPAAFSCL
mmetsp:Transcript_27694/g.57644  ORF Transcript_27694/g.57644 Transcript_27694/m.57644 type:complete len:281 (-) Transcript_27694:659-1501(-)